MKKKYVFLVVLLVSFIPLTNAQTVPAEINFFTTEGYTNNSELDNNANWQTNATWNNQLYCSDTYGYQRYTANWARSQWQTLIQATMNQIISLRLDFDPSSGTVANSKDLLNFGLISASGIPNLNADNSESTYIKTDATGNYTLDGINNGSTACVIGERTYVVVQVTLGENAANSIFSAQLFNATDDAISKTSVKTGIPIDLYTAITGTGAYAVFGAQAFKSTGGFQRIDISRMKVSVTNAQSSATYDGTSWDSESPIGTTDTSKDIIITSGNIAFSGTSSFKSLTINPGASATLPTGNSITTVDDTVLNAGASLIAEGTSTITGDVTYNRTIDYVATDNLKGWYLMASPVAHSSFSVDTFTTNNDIATSNSNVAIADYETQNDTWSYFQVGATSNFVAGKGYSIKKASTTGTVSFTGTLNTNDAGVDIVLSSEGNRYNLLGNPYTSYISHSTFLENADLSETQTIWVYDQTLGINGSYVVKTLAEDFILAPGQGFFVKANAAGGSVNFAETNQNHSSDTFQRAAKTAVTIKTSVDDAIHYAKLYYLNTATTGFDVGYEGEVFGGTTDEFSIYTHLLKDNDGKKYQVQSLPNSEYESMVIPVGVKAAANKEITFSAEVLSLPADIKVLLEDKQTNIFTRLDEANSNYKITLTENLDGIGRFYLHTTSSVLSTNDMMLNHISIYTSSKNLHIYGVQNGISKVRLYNLLSKKILTTSFGGNGINIPLPSFNSGVYIVQLETETGMVNKKIILN
jgi:hypothetical protein